MIRCRPARFSDLDREDLKALVMRGLTSGAQGVIPIKVWGMCRGLIAGPQNHAAVAFEGERGVGYLGAMRVPTWGEKDRFLVVGWFSEAPGAGFALLRGLIARARSDDGIGEVMVTANAEPRLSKVLQRYGATPAPSYILKT